MADMPAQAVNREVLTFRADGRRMALPAADVAEIIRPRPLTRVPHAQPSLLGLLNLRGTILPVVSMNGLLGRPSRPTSSATRVIVLSRSPPLGLLVDEVADLSSASNEQLIDLDALLAREFVAPKRKPRPKTVAETDAQLAPKVMAEELLVFAVAGQEYALRLHEVQEIEPLPPQISLVPGSDLAMLGVMDWRGTLLPLVSLHALLGLPSDDFDKGKARIVVMRFGAHWAGLVADKMSQILLVPNTALDPVPPVLTRGRGEAKIEAICRVDGGARLISLLAGAKLFDATTASRILAQTGRGASPMSGDKADGERAEQFVIFQLGDENYGLPIAAVDEITRCPEKLTRVPHAPPFIEGVMNLRGKIIPVIDQRLRFQIQEKNGSRACRIIVVTTAGLQAGFIVDNVSEIVGVSVNELNSPPELTSSDAALFDRIATVERDGKMILLIDPKALLDRVERDLLATMADEPVPAP